jgi:HPt (histidine-containing phosphotransfer) domain-containing protein
MLERYAPPVGTRTGRHVVRPVERTVVERPEISTERFHEVTCGDAELAHGLVETFIESCEKCLRDVDTGLARSDLKLAGRAAHTLVGSSANIGASHMQSLAVSMEEAAGRGDAGAVRDLLPALRARFKSARDALRSLIS